MPISRALLNRLRLPYKALEIQGSKGDVLYIPDDVGVDLSVMHGVHNGDMVPVKTDADGIVSVAVDNVLGATFIKERLSPDLEFNVTDTLNLHLIDTSKYLNYMFRIFVINSNDNTATITLHIGRDWESVAQEVVLTVTLNATSGQNHTAFMLSSDSTVTSQHTFIDSVLNHSGKVSDVQIIVVGYN